MLQELDAFARRQKRHLVAESRRGIKIAREGGAKAIGRARIRAGKTWTRRRRRASHLAAMWGHKLYKPVKTAVERLRNAPTIARNLSRKAVLYVWGLRRPILRWQARRQRMNEKWTALRTELRLEQEIERLAETGDPIVVGPWMSEVGYETLYWVPFIRWFRSTYRIKPDRMLVLTRGGAAAWYADITPHRAEIFDYVTPDRFMAYNATRVEAPGGTIKQFDMDVFERDLVERARADWGVRRVQVLHPSLMYRLFRQFWAGNRALSFLDEHTMYRVLSPPDDASTRAIDLPGEYVAMKFYTAQSLQSTPHTREMLRALIGAVAERYPVVLLDTGLVLDEHDDYAFSQGQRVMSAREWMAPRNNLAIQTRIIAGARAFVGTCGGVAWLAPMLGVDTTAVMTDDKALTVHLQVARRVTRVLDAGRFTPLDLGAFGALGLTVTDLHHAVLDRP
jgi:hypothetical protein